MDVRRVPTCQRRPKTGRCGTTSLAINLSSHRHPVAIIFLFCKFNQNAYRPSRTDSFVFALPTFTAEAVTCRRTNGTHYIKELITSLLIIRGCLLRPWIDLIKWEEEREIECHKETERWHRKMDEQRMEWRRKVDERQMENMEWRKKMDEQQMEWRRKMDERDVEWRKETERWNRKREEREKARKT